MASRKNQQPPWYVFPPEPMTCIATLRPSAFKKNAVQWLLFFLSAGAPVAHAVACRLRGECQSTVPPGGMTAAIFRSQGSMVGTTPQRNEHFVLLLFRGMV